MALYSTPTGRLASASVHADVGVFLALEAELMDSRDFAAWLELVEPEFSYAVPVPVTPDNPAADAFEEEALIVDETRDTLAEHWFVRYEPEMWEIAWAENPPVRYRHFVTNVRVRETHEPGLLDVRSNAIVSAVRQSSASTALHVGRFDLVTGTPGAYRLRRRVAIIDETVLDFAQLRVIL